MAEIITEQLQEQRDVPVWEDALKKEVPDMTVLEMKADYGRQSAQVNRLSSGTSIRLNFCLIVNSTHLHITGCSLM